MRLNHCRMIVWESLSAFVPLKGSGYRPTRGSGPLGVGLVREDFAEKAILDLKSNDFGSRELRR